MRSNMNTKYLTTEIAEAAELLRGGGLVAVPTETVYGLACNGLDAEAVERVYEVKGRPAVKPLSLMVPGKETMELYCEDVPETAYRLAERFWPGPLTIVLRAKPEIPAIVRAGGETVGLRCPDHPLTLALLREAGVPFAAPSANPSGAPSPQTAQEVAGYFDGQIEAILDGGACTLGTESTLISLAQKPYRVLRQGALAAETIAETLCEDMTLIGITGGSGSGKTTVLRLLEKRGALVIDCDALYHDLLRTDTELLTALDGAFPGTVREGKLDRRALAAMVFSDPAKLKALNGIAHRHIMAAVRERLRAHAMAGGTLAAVDAIELISSGLAEACDLTLAVTAPRETRLARIMARDGLTRAEAEQRLNAQHEDTYFSDRCSAVLVNDGDEAALTKQFNRLMKEKLGWTN